MNLKIFHTSDLHIGLKFASYPDAVRENLLAARFLTLEKMVRRANEEECQIFAIAGDLFDSIKVPKRDVDKVITILEKFAGECVLVLPGNHDYDNGMADNLWQTFKTKMSDKILLLSENRPYDLNKYNLKVVIYPAPCNEKHSPENNLGWIKGLEEKPEAAWHIGMAHGAIEGLSPDLNKQYFSMSVGELETLPVDLWLLGHTHLPYPQKDEFNSKVYNAGTPEPDGLDCSHEGYAWLIEVDLNKKISSKKIKTGTYRFIDAKEKVERESCFHELQKKYLSQGAEKLILRLNLGGRVDQELFKTKENFYESFNRATAYFKVEDQELGIKITKDVIDKEFTKGSLPHQFLSELSTDEDEAALQLAYELLQEVKAI